MSADIEAALARAEDALAEGRSLSRTGFWKAVEAVRRDSGLADRYAERIGAIDRRAFEHGVSLRLPAWTGVTGLALLSAVGVVAILLAHRASRGRGALDLLESHGVDAYRWRGFVPIAFLIGFVALIVGTHSLAHWIVGRLFGMRFSHVFLGGPTPPRPGFKTDYATYLRVSPRKRAVMHASGAVVTKVVPFALLPVSLTFYRAWPWLTWVLLAVGIVGIVTDITLSTKLSDWKKVLRELRAAKG